jgi:hypothetical protein
LGNKTKKSFLEILLGGLLVRPFVIFGGVILMENSLMEIKVQELKCLQQLMHQSLKINAFYGSINLTKM